jgi:hypothetical protein
MRAHTVVDESLSRGFPGDARGDRRRIARTMRALSRVSSDTYQSMCIPIFDHETATSPRSHGQRRRRSDLIHGRDNRDISGFGITDHTQLGLKNQESFLSIAFLQRDLRNEGRVS